MKLSVKWTADDVVQVLKSVNGERMSLDEAARRLRTKTDYVRIRCKWLKESGTPLEPPERRRSDKSIMGSSLGRNGRVYGVQKAAEGMTFADETGQCVRWEPPVISQRKDSAWCLECGEEQIHKGALGCPRCGSDRILPYYTPDGPRGEGERATITLRDRMKITLE